MIGAAPDFDLDDVESVLGRDRSGALRSAASAGAQVRSIATAAAEGALDALAGLRPRALVLVVARGPAVAAASVGASVLGPEVDVPLVLVDRVPDWVGSLDLVVMLGDDPGDRDAAFSASEALRRGAATVVSAEPEGPVGAAAGSGAIMLPPRVPVWPAHRFAHHLAVVCAVIATARSGRAGRVLGSGRPAESLSTIADLLDGEALRDGPGRATLGNPAKTLAQRMLGRDVVIAGDDPATAALATRAAADLLSTAGVVAAGAELVDVLLAPTVGAVSADRALFHDEQIDGPLPGAPRRVFVFVAEADARRIATRTAPLGDAEIVVADLPGIPAASGSQGDGTAAGDRPDGPDEPNGGPSAPDVERMAHDPPAIVQLAVLALRWQMAAGYVGLAAAEAEGPR